MNNRIKELIQKPDTEALDQADMAYAIEEYIYEKKGKTIKTQLPDKTHPMYNHMPEPVFHQAIVIPESNKLANAYNDANSINLYSQIGNNYYFIGQK